VLYQRFGLLLVDSIQFLSVGLVIHQHHYNQTKKLYSLLKNGIFSAFLHLTFFYRPCCKPFFANFHQGGLQTRLFLMVMHQPLRYAGQYADSETGLHYTCSAITTPRSDGSPLRIR